MGFRRRRRAQGIRGVDLVPKARPGFLTLRNSPTYGAAARFGGQVGASAGAAMTGDSGQDDFDARLKRAREAAGLEPRHESAERAPSPPALGIGARVGIDLVASLAVGIGIGYGLDRWLGTRPWLMILFTVLGMAAGVLSVYRTVRGMGYAVGYRAPPRNDGR